MLPFEDIVIECIKSRTMVQKPRCDLKSLFDSNNMSVFLKTCTKRIIEADLVDGKNILPELSHQYDLLMTDDGLTNAKGILISYIPEDIIDKTIDNLKEAEDYLEIVNNHVTKFMLLSRSELKLIRRKDFGDMDVTPEVAESMSRVATAELEARKLTSKISRKFVKGILKILIRHKYRKVLNSVS